ncbi:transcription termination factor NusA [Chloroflexota bacterium]
MKTEFLIAITQLSAEKNLPKEVVISAVEAALVSAFRKDNFAPHQNISVKLDYTTGKVEVWAEKAVVEQSSDQRREITLDEARKIKPDAEIGDVIEAEATPHNAGRIAAQTAKQVILQRLHEAEHSAVLEEYASREGDIVTGLVHRVETKQIFIDLGRTEAVLPVVEQVHTERYRVGQRLRVYIMEVVRTSKGPRVIVSRSHPNFLRRLFELEVPEVFNGIVELKSIAREAGYRSKVAVAARQEDIDPVGSCVGLRGIRIQNIVNELNGEKLDVVTWDPNQPAFIANALSPAHVMRVELNKEEGIATVVVPDRQLSLAIGKEGQNARLAAKLTGWRIDIKSTSVAEAARVAEAKIADETEEETPAVEELDTEIPAVPEPASVLAEGEAAETLPAPDTEVIIPVVEPPVTADVPELRFAEDILAPRPAKPGTKQRKKKKKTTPDRETAVDGVKIKKQRRSVDVLEEEEEY